MLLKRLNDLRKFLQEVERIYSTVTRIRSIITKALERVRGVQDVPCAVREVGGAARGAPGTIREVRRRRSDDIEAEMEKLEDLIIEELQKSLDDPAGLGALLEHFFIPADATERSCARSCSTSRRASKRSATWWRSTAASTGPVWRT